MSIESTPHDFESARDASEGGTGPCAVCGQERRAYIHSQRAQRVQAHFGSAVPEEPVTRALPKPGDRIRVTGTLPNDPAPLDIGEMGTVRSVSASTEYVVGTIDVGWDSGRTLSLLHTDPWEVRPPFTRTREENEAREDSERVTEEPADPEVARLEFIEWLEELGVARAAAEVAVDSYAALVWNEARTALVWNEARTALVWEVVSPIGVQTGLIRPIPANPYLKDA